jgi:hypothetical protein
VGLFVQLPFVAVSVWPSVVVPLIVGGEVLAGAAGAFLAMVAVPVEMDDPDPPALLALTVMRRVCAASLELRVWVEDVAPLTLEHSLLAVLQRIHW